MVCCISYAFSYWVLHPTCSAGTSTTERGIKKRTCSTAFRESNGLSMNSLKITCHNQELEEGKCKVCGRVYDFTIKVTEPIVKKKIDWYKEIKSALIKTVLVIMSLYILFFLLTTQCSIK